MKTNELIGPALDWSVAKALGIEYRYMASTGGDYNGNWWWQTRGYSTDWSQGGPIIERERIGTYTYGKNWTACGANMLSSKAQYGPTLLIAAMRCFVASKFGDEIEIPKEFL